MNPVAAHSQNAVTAGHPAPLLLSDHRIVAELKSPTTLPVGYGGATPVVTDRALEQGDRVLFLTDGVVEEDRRGGADGQARLRVLVERVSDLDGSVGLTRSLPNDARLPRWPRQDRS